MFNLNRDDEYKDMNIKKNFIISIEIHGIDFDILHQYICHNFLGCVRIFLTDILTFFVQSYVFFIQ